MLLNDYDACVDVFAACVDVFLFVLVCAAAADARSGRFVNPDLGNHQIAHCAFC